MIYLLCKKREKLCPRDGVCLRRAYNSLALWFSTAGACVCVGRHVSQDTKDTVRVTVAVSEVADLSDAKH